MIFTALTRTFAGKQFPAIRSAIHLLPSAILQPVREWAQSPSRILIPKKFLCYFKNIGSIYSRLNYDLRYWSRRDGHEVRFAWFAFWELAWLLPLRYHFSRIVKGLLPAHVKQQRGPCVNMKQMNIPNAQLLNCFPLHPPLSHDDRWT